MVETGNESGGCTVLVGREGVGWDGGGAGVDEDEVREGLGGGRKKRGCGGRRWRGGAGSVGGDIRMLECWGGEGERVEGGVRKAEVGRSKGREGRWNLCKREKKGGGGDGEKGGGGTEMKGSGGGERQGGQVGRARGRYLWGECRVDLRDVGHLGPSVHSQGGFTKKSKRTVS